MKHSYKISITVAICIMFFYAACKKGSNPSSAPKTATEQQVSGLIAVNIAKSLAGAYGGVNINDGVKAPQQILSAPAKLRVNSTPASLCGYNVDTNVVYNYNVGDTIKSTVTGNFNFTYTCSGTTPDGYKVHTSVLDIGTAPAFSFIYSIAQNYTVQALNAQYTLVSLNGTLKSYGDFKTQPKAFVDTNFVKTPNYQHQDYVLTGLKVNVGNNYDVISGTATFVSAGSNSSGVWNYVGTIVFLGNHKATITINGKVYNADLTTGTVTPA